jgi:glutathionylspermidine synthase
MFEQGKMVAQTSGVYQGATIFQQKANTFTDGVNRAIIGSWVVGDQPAGMIIRDHDQLIVQDVSKVVPHWFS